MDFLVQYWSFVTSHIDHSTIGKRPRLIARFIYGLLSTKLLVSPIMASICLRTSFYKIWTTRSLIGGKAPNLFSASSDIPQDPMTLGASQNGCTLGPDLLVLVSVSAHSQHAGSSAAPRVASVRSNGRFPQTLIPRCYNTKARVEIAAKAVAASRLRRRIHRISSKSMISAAFPEHCISTPSLPFHQIKTGLNRRL